MTDAILGTKTTLKGLDGDVPVEIKPGTQSAEVITIKDRGIGHLRGSGRGDLKIGIQVVTPTKLSAKEQELVKQLATARKPVAPYLAQFQQGLFAKLRDRFLNV
jgi:molecular chaperone DnaJ